jgi:hypothetical protein
MLRSSTVSPACRRTPSYIIKLSSFLLVNKTIWHSSPLMTVGKKCRSRIVTSLLPDRLAGNMESHLGSKSKGRRRTNSARATEGSCCTPMTYRSSHFFRLVRHVRQPVFVLSLGSGRRRRSPGLASSMQSSAIRQFYLQYISFHTRSNHTLCAMEMYREDENR